MYIKQYVKKTVSCIAIMAVMAVGTAEAQVSQMMRPSELGMSGRTGVSQQNTNSSTPFDVFDRASIFDNDIGKTEAKENKVEQKETPTESKKENVNSSQVPDNESVTILKMINSDKNRDPLYDGEGATFFFKGADTVTVAIPKGDKSPEAEAYRKSLAIPKGDKSPEAEAYRKSLEAALDQDLSDLAFFDRNNIKGVKSWTKSRLYDAEEGYKKAQDQLTEMDKDKERLEELKKKQAEAKENEGEWKSC